MNSREFVADPNRPDEATARWIYQPSNIPLQAPAHSAIAYPLPLFNDSVMAGDPSTSMGLPYVPQPTPLAPFKFDQQAANPVESIHTQETQLSEDVQRQLAELEWQHEVARYQILEKAQVVPANPHVQDTTDSYPCTAMDWTASGYTGADDYTMMPVTSPQILNQGLISSDSRTARGFDANLWPSQQLPPPNVYPITFQNHVQDISQQNSVILGVQDVDYNAFGHSAYSQQPAIHPVTFETSHHRMIPSVLSPHDQGNHCAFSMAPSRPPFIQPGLPLYDVRSSPVVLGGFPTCQTNRPLHGLITPHEDAGWDSQTPLAPGQLLNAIIPAINYPDSIHLDAAGLIGPQYPVTNMRRLDRGDKRKRSISDSAHGTMTRSGREMDEIELYEGPNADRPRQKPHPKVYSKRVKVNPRACFGCRRQNRRCEISSNGICLRCQNILRTYSHCTVLPKFTCDVRTKFSEIPIYADTLPDLSLEEAIAKLLSNLTHPFIIDWDDGYPPVTIRGSKTSTKCVGQVISRLIGRVRNLLDVLEPLSFRQLSSPWASNLTFWSYSFSIIKWKSAMCFFWPDLQDALDFHDSFHLAIHQPFLRLLEAHNHVRNPLYEARWLNVWHEGLTAIGDSPLLNVPAKEHFLSSIIQRLLHLYRSIFSTCPGRTGPGGQAELEALSARFKFFPQTSELLPRYYHPLMIGDLGSSLMRGQKDLWTRRKIPPWALTDSTPFHEAFRQISRTSWVDADAYCSAKLTDVFEPSQDTLDLLERFAQDTIRDIRDIPALQRESMFDHSPWDMDTMSDIPALEGESLFDYSSRILDANRDIPETQREFMMDYSPWTLSIALKAFLSQFDLGICPTFMKPVILKIIVMDSFQVYAAINGGFQIPANLQDRFVNPRDVLEVALINMLHIEHLTAYSCLDEDLKLVMRRA